MKKILSIILSFLFSTWQPAYAAVDKETQLAVDELMTIFNSKQVVNLMARALTSQMMKSLTEEHGPLDPAVAEIIYSEASVIMYEKYILNNKLRDIVHSLYDEYFTADEVKAIVEFFKSPAGQRYLQVNSQISERSMLMVQEFSDTFIDEAQVRVGKKLKKAIDILKARDAGAPKAQQP